MGSAACSEHIQEKVTTDQRYGFVVLHYVAYDMTIECVSLLLDRFSEYDIHVVIVDNASPNGSGKLLSERFADDDRVTVLESDVNVGFARGNNLGYRYLVANIHPDYIVVMNNDVLVEQQEFLDLVDVVYHRTGYAVLGPDIFSPTSNSHQNPAEMYGPDLREVKRRYHTYSRYCKYPAYYYARHVLLGGVRRILHRRHVRESQYMQELEGVVLHGACYVFSREFINLRKVCFCPETFLYGEEEILHYECGQRGLKMIYSPELRVVHMEDVSTNASITSEYERYTMKFREAKRSAGVLLRKMTQS